MGSRQRTSKLPYAELAQGADFTWTDELDEVWCAMKVDEDSFISAPQAEEHHPSVLGDREVLTSQKWADLSKELSDEGKGV